MRGVEAQHSTESQSGVFSPWLKEESRRQPDLLRRGRPAEELARMEAAILSRKKQVAAGAKNVIEEKDAITRGDGGQERIESRGRPQAPGISRAYSSGGVEFAAAIQRELQLRPAAENGNIGQDRRGGVQILLISLRLHGRKRQTAEAVKPLATEKRAAQLQLCDQRKLPIHNRARGSYHLAIGITHATVNSRQPERNRTIFRSIVPG